MELLFNCIYFQSNYIERQDYLLNEDIKVSSSLYDSDNPEMGKQLKATPKPAKNIGMDLNNEFYSNIINGVKASNIDIAKIQSFTQASQTRETIYQLLDTMAEDSSIAAILETYAEDATEADDRGNVVWVESDNDDIVKYITYLLNSIQINKHIYKWVYSLCKYGDIYIRLYRNSDVDKELFNNIPQTSNSKQLKEALKESINLNVYSKDDKLVHYVEMYPNPADIFELTRFGKTCAYIQVKSSSQYKQADNLAVSNSYKYSFKSQDINIYDAMTFVHASIEDNSSRTPEQVEIFLDNNDSNTGSQSYTYTVKRGQSLLYGSFKAWREMMLLQNALLLNRITKSSVIRIVGVEVGDMPKENVGPHLMSIKSLMEQKSTLDTGNGTAEYTNPGPMENNIYVPTHGGIGSISLQTLGGDVDVKGLSDIDYFTNRLYGALRVPKQFMGFTDDATGFNGGTSLTIISSRYAKMIKRIQNTIIQAITDIINIMLIDKHLDSYIYKFKIKMLPPTTQEDIDRRDNMSTKINIVSDIMNLLSDLPDESAKLDILKKLLSGVISDGEILQILSEQKDKLEQTDELDMNEADDQEEPKLNNSHISSPSHSKQDLDVNIDNPENDTEPLTNDSSSNTESPSNDSADLPSPADLNSGDFTTIQ